MASGRARPGASRGDKTVEISCARSRPVQLAEFRAGPQRLIDELAVLFLIVRIAYVFTYLGDRPTLRSILWSLGFAINLAIFFLPAIRGWLPG